MNWCEENNRIDLLDLWDYKLNDKNPNEIYCRVSKKFYFKCSNGEHDSWQVILSNITGIARGNKYKHICRKCNSFESWCKKNNYLEALSLWDYELNDEHPIDVPSKSNNKYWFKCSRGIHKPTQLLISNIERNHGVICHKCNSVGQYLVDKYGENALDIYWDFELNRNEGNEPYSVSRGSAKKIAIRCIEKSYHGTYWVRAGHFCSDNVKCNYCGHKQLHRLDSLGVDSPQVLNIWSSKNNESPFDFSPFSSQSVWWKCECGEHKDYYREISNSKIYEFRCPECSRENIVSNLHIKISKYLKSYSVDFLTEHKCNIVLKNPKTKFNLPFDFEVVEHKLIIECHGEQHMELQGKNSLFLKNLTPQQYLHKRQLYDRYKKYRAYLAGYNYLAIPYWTEKNDEYKKLIDEAIAQIQAGQRVNTKIA